MEEVDDQETKEMIQLRLDELTQKQKEMLKQWSGDSIDVETMRQIINESNNMLANALYEQIIRILKLMNKISIDSKEREEWLYVEQEKLIKEQRKLNENRQNIKPNKNKIPPNFKKKTNVAERSIFKKYKASDPISKSNSIKMHVKNAISLKKIGIQKQDVPFKVSI